jgi:RHS repeat-associated protein
VVAIEGNNVIVEISIAPSGLVARDPHVAAVTVLGSAAAGPPIQHSLPAAVPQRSFVPRTNNSCTPAGLPCSTGTYLYDGSGNIKQIGNDTFVYDEVSRLTSAALPSTGGMGETYTYDAFGNMQSVSSTTGEGRPTITTDKATNHLDPAVTHASYDEAGNLKSWPGHTYTYDPANMLIDMVATATGEHAAYVYTADDERIAVLNVVSSTAYEGTWRLRGLDNKVVREYRESNGSGQAQPWSWSRDYIYRGGLLLSSYLSTSGGTEKRYDYHLDHLGTPRLITDAAGRKISAHNYYLFGAEITWTDAVAETMTFTGHERDSSTTAVGPNRDYWYYMHARYDSPNLGRFLSVDPSLDVDQAAAQPQLWNRYTYVGNNPILFGDADGKERLPLRMYRNIPGGANALASAGRALFHYGKVVMDVAAPIIVTAVSIYEVAKYGISPGPQLERAEESFSEVPAAVEADMAAADTALAMRAEEIQSTLSAATQRRTTTAAASVRNPDGSIQTLIGSSEKALRPGQRAALRPNETAVTGGGHAEQTVINAAKASGQQVNAVAASRPICPSCAAAIQQAGARAASPLKKPAGPCVPTSNSSGCR